MPAHRNQRYTQAQVEGALDRVRRGYSVPEAARLSGVNKAKIYRELQARAVGEEDDVKGL